MKTSFQRARRGNWRCPTSNKKSSERFLSLDEFRSLLSDALPREHLVLRILGVCGLRPAEVLVLRNEDFEGTQFRIDEALKERQKGMRGLETRRRMRATISFQCRLIWSAR
jgi:integrase